jgi:hypothetical protein
MLNCIHTSASSKTGVVRLLRANLTAPTPATQDREGSTVLIPATEIDSYVSPNPLAVAMQMLLVIIMATQLFGRLQDAVGVASYSENDTFASPFLIAK